MNRIVIKLTIGAIFLFFSEIGFSQTCGNCVSANFVAGCDNGVDACTSGSSACTTFNGSIQDFPDQGGDGDTPEYCTDFVTPASISGSSSFGMGAISLLNTTDVGGNSCGFSLAVITLYDAACTTIVPTGPIDDFGAWDTWEESQICCNTNYTICFQYVGYSCPGAATVNHYLPEIYYIEEEENASILPTVDFAVVDLDVCETEPIVWADGGACEGLDVADDVVELYMWTGADPCAPVDPPAIPACAGIDDIADVSADLTLVAGNFTCASPPMSPPVAWDNACLNPCGPKVVTFYLITRNNEMDCDGDGVFDFRPGSEVAIIRFDVNVHPDLSTWTVNETAGDCAAGPLAELISAGDGSVCEMMQGDPAPAGTCPDTDGMSTFNYTFTSGSGTESCNKTGSIDAVCPPEGCISCPDIAPAITPQEVCSGSDPDFATIEAEVNATGDNIGGFSYFLDAAFATPYTPQTMMGCGSRTVTIYGRLMCSDASAAGTDEEFDDFSFDITVNADVSTWTVTETEGDCGVPASIIITSENGTVCYTETGAAPIFSCPSTPGTEPLNYMYDPGLGGTCNMIFSGTVQACCTEGCCADAGCFPSVAPRISNAKPDKPQGEEKN